MFVNVVEHYRSSVILDCNIILNILRAVVTVIKLAEVAVHILYKLPHNVTIILHNYCIVT